jgi:hypothetical protein
VVIYTIDSVKYKLFKLLGFDSNTFTKRYYSNVCANNFILAYIYERILVYYSNLTNLGNYNIIF